MRTVDPPLPWLVRVTFLIVALVLVAGALLFIAPSLLVPLWPWALKPFNARFLGAIYLGEMVAVLCTLLSNRWSLARLTVPQAAVFTGAVTLASLLSLSHFDFSRPLVWGWFVIYLLPLVILAWFAWQKRGWSSSSARPTPAGWRWALRLQALLLALYGLALFLFPLPASAFWPWALDSFHGRVYSALFFTGAVGAWLLQRRATALEWKTLGGTQLVLSGAVIAGLLLADAQVRRVEWSAPGVWLWLAGFGLVAVVGAGMLARRTPT
ncbi:MAG: hypothetical protein HY328_14405 [Chloroflexi bacterium]|nr:hypothetical protein [Chloroflexota bacterium]